LAQKRRAKLEAPRRLLLAAAAVLALSAPWTPDVASLKSENPRDTALMRLREREMRESGRTPYRIFLWTPYDSISPYLRRAVVLAEDDAFYRHRGIDAAEVRRALLRDLRQRRFAYGGSTITQQLAKNLYLSPSKNPLRKLAEMILAWRLEGALDKRRILEIYLNVVEWGPGIYGAEAASLAYFGKPAVDLTAEEAAALAVTLPNPRRYNPLKEGPYLRARKRYVLRQLSRLEDAEAAPAASFLL